MVSMGSFSEVRRRLRSTVVVVATVAALATIAPMTVSSSTASAAPSASVSPSTAPSAVVEEATPSFPMPVREGAIGYLATRSATLWLASRGADAVIANLPVPPAYATANRAMAKTLERELDAAAKTPGACLQIIIDRTDGAGGLFNYGFFAVEKQYCPR